MMTGSTSKSSLVRCVSLRRAASTDYVAGDPLWEIDGWVIKLITEKTASVDSFEWGDCCFRGRLVGAVEDEVWKSCIFGSQHLQLLLP